MWCVRDAEDVKKGPDLKYDQALGWLHRKDGSWHTLGGTDVTGGGGGGGGQFRKHRVYDPPARIARENLQ